MKEVKTVALGEKELLKTGYGPVSFGLVVNSAVVSWSGKGHKDLLISRCWEGVYLYPTESLEAEELAREPIKVCGSIVPLTIAMPADWNKDGVDELLVADRRGFLHFMERKGKFPEISFEYKEILKDKKSGLLFNIPFDNPNLGVIDDLGGYDDPVFSNYLNPVIYPSSDKGAIDLIIGDSAGNLWWMPDVASEGNAVEYTGTIYEKPIESCKTKYGREYIEKYGDRYVKPSKKICDETGEPFLLGIGVNVKNVYKGGNTRPIVYRNGVTGSMDLIVLAGVNNNVMYYLQYVNSDESNRPSFRNLGEIKIAGLKDENTTHPLSYHSHMAALERDGQIDIIVSYHNKMAILKNKRFDEIKPEFEFEGLISGRDVTTSGYNFKEILEDNRDKKKYIVDSNGIGWEFRQVTILDNVIRISSDSIPLKDQNGIFKVKGETDPTGGEEWGFHRAVKWNFDGSGKQHLIVGTDKGLLYLLINNESPADGEIFSFKSVGPLKDINNKVIKIHNRVSAAAVDLNNDGLEDLIVGGASYQLGVRTDPCPGGGIYYIINKGVDADGLPILEPARELPVKGKDIGININNMVEVQVMDIDSDLEEEVIIGYSSDQYKGWIFKLSKDPLEIVFTDSMLPKFDPLDHIIDIDGDGKPEYVFAGGEPGVGYYQKVIL